jgi:hypothetical protein
MVQLARPPLRSAQSASRRRRALANIELQGFMVAPQPQLRVRFLGAMDPIILAHRKIPARRLPLPFPLVA